METSTKYRSILIGMVLSILVTSTATAEPGDYSFLRTLANLASPPAADNPVTPAQRNGIYPLLPDPASFNDGFNPKRYYDWQTIQLSASTGAVCGNGSPYKFFVSRVPNTKNTILYMEGGGACWDYASCTGQTGVRGARNPNGIPDDYLSLLNPGASLVSPFTVRLNPLDRVKTQNWNIVYVPYCTGDIYSGDKIAVYSDPAGKNPDLIWHHNGVRNTRAVIAWLKNNLPRPTQLLSTGCSAGGAGSMISYSTNRRDIAPDFGYMINDSGPIFLAPSTGDSREFPSVLLQNFIRQAWGLNATNGPLSFIDDTLPLLNTSQLGTIYAALSAKYPNDRLGHTHFWKDLNYSSYSYERFYPEIQNALDQATKEQRISARWKIDTERLQNELKGISNFGGYFPQFRALNESHCTTVVDFKNADIQAQNLELKNFIDSVLDGRGPVLDASEDDDSADRAKPFNPLYLLIDQLL